MYPLIPFIIIIGTVFIAIGAVKFFRYQIARKGLRSPFTQKLERFPGQGLLKRLDELNEEISIQTAALLSVPIAIYAGCISNLYFGQHPLNPAEAILAVVIAVVFLGFTLYKLRGLRKPAAGLTGRPTQFAYRFCDHLAAVLSEKHKRV